jgi:hypothetical protein
VFANHLSDGNFSVLLLPGADPEEQRWQIFTTDVVMAKSVALTSDLMPALCSTQATLSSF